jgi:hypothetical protein
VINFFFVMTWCAAILTAQTKMTTERASKLPTRNVRAQLKHTHTHPVQGPTRPE